MDSKFLDQVWGEILSRTPTRIRRAYKKLDSESQKVVIDHLNKMVIEEGWQEVQIVSARHALQALTKISNE